MKIPPRKTISFILLVFIVFLGILTRFYKLGEIPAGLYLDEAGQGYSAYSILKTGKDEFGKVFPIVFRSFVDFKTPVYIYMVAPLIPLFGLTAFTVRFPSFLFSILTLPLIYLLLEKISPKKISVPLSILTSFLIAISPWHILFGRTNFECNVALFFFLAGVYFFYRGLKKPKTLLISAIMFAIAIPTYHAQRVVTPLMGLFLFIRHRKILLSKKHMHRKYLVIGTALALLIMLPTLSVATTPGFLARAAGLNIFAYGNKLPYGYLSSYQGVFRNLVNNPIFLSVEEFLSLYISYFSPRNMFILGDYGPRSSFPELATFFVWQFPFYLYGLYSLIKNKNLKELRFFTITLLLISPLPAAVTRDPYSTIRALQMVVPQIIIISLGLIKVFQLLKKRVFKTAAISAFAILVVYSLMRLYSSVIVLNEYFRAPYWNYGWKQMTETFQELNPDLPIVIDSARSEPYSQILFFIKFDPATYQRENHEVALDNYYTDMTRLETRKIGRITTRTINWKYDLSKKQYLVGDALAISYQQIREHNLSLIDEIYYPDGSVAFRIIETNP